MRNTEIRELFLENLESIEISREDYKKLFEASLELIRRQKVPKELALETLDQYTERLQELAGIDISLNKIRDYDPKTQEKIKALLLFGTQAVLINNNSRLLEELKLINQNYDELINLVTHEFKNILTSIYGYNSIIKKYSEEHQVEDIEEPAVFVESLARKMFGMVDSLLKMAQSEKGSLPVKKELVNFAENVISPVEDEIKVLLDDKLMSVEKEVNKEEIVLIADADLLQVVMRNLLENAIKYGSENSKIELKIFAETDVLKISVKNYGSSIPEEFHKRVFEKFWRSDSNEARGGSGIGLYNVKKILDVHEGSITLESKDGEWTQFNIVLPVNIN